MTVLSYNVEYGLKLSEIYKWINALDKKPQIICFQEFPEDELLNLENNKIFSNQIICFTKGLASKGKYFGELTVFDNSEIKLISNINLDFRSNGIENLYRRRKIKRSAIITSFKKENLEFSLANIHLTPLSLHGLRRKQLEEVVETIQKDKSIILGDFNYSSLLNRNGLISFMHKHSYKIAGEKLVTNKYKYKIPQQLDYIFYKNLKVKNVEVLSLPYSDHFPIIADLEI